MDALRGEEWWRVGLFQKLALLLFLSLSSIYAVAVLWASLGGARLADEWLERSHVMTSQVFAESIAVAISDSDPSGHTPYIPGTSPDLDEKILSLFRNAVSWNQRIEPYLVARTGEVLLANRKESIGKKVSMYPIARMLRFELPSFPLYGDDPSDAEVFRPFAAARVESPRFSGFLYLTLSHPLSELLRSAAGKLEVTIRLAPVICFFTLAACIGFFVVIRYMAARFRRLVQAAGRLAQGDYATSVPVDTQDTFGELAESFNRMRESILRQDEQLERRESRRRQLLANVAHDLRVPLSVVSGLIELLRPAEGREGAGSPRKSSADRATLAAAIVRNVRRERDFLADLDSLADLEFERAPIQQESVELRECVRDLVSTLSGPAEAAAKRLVFDEGSPTGSSAPVSAADDEALHVEGNRSWIERMLLNLMNNAVRYTPEGGSITVRLYRYQDSAVIEVEDTGIGIPSEALPHVFDEFYRVDRPAETDPGGTGLGLSIVRRVVEFHRGKISVDSAVGEGSRFTVTLPLHVAFPRRGESIGEQDYVFIETAGAQAAGEPMDLQFEPPRLRPLYLRQIIRNQINVGSLPPRAWERRGLGLLLSFVTVGASLCVLLSFEINRSIIWSLLALLALHGVFRGPVVGYLSVFAPFIGSIVFYFAVCKNLVILALVAAGLFVVMRRMRDRREHYRALVGSSVTFGLLFACIPWMLGNRFPAATVPLLTITLFTVLYSLAFLTRSFEIWLSGAGPFLVTLLGFLATTIKYETPLIGLSGGLVLGVLLLSNHTEKTSRRIEVRLITFFAVIVTLACFLVTYLIIGIWIDLAREAAIPELSSLSDHISIEFEKAATASSESEQQEVLNNMFQFNPLTALARWTDTDRLTSMSGLLDCRFDPCRPVTVVKDSMPLAINDGRLGRLFYRDKKDGLPIVFQRLSFTNRKESSFFLGYGFQNKIARELVRLYTGLSMLFIPAAIIAIAVIMRLILKYLISDPLLAVQDAIGRFRSDENARVANPGRDEIGKLGMAFNMMAEARVFRRKALIDADRRRRDLIEAILKGFSNPLGRLEQCSMELKRLTSVDCTPAAPSSQTDSLVMEIERLVRLQSDLVDDLFTLSKLENVAAIPLEDPVAVDELLDELASRVGHRELQVSREGEAVYFEADAERLARAMSEYVSALADDPRGTGPVNAAIRNASNTVTVELLRHSGSESIDQKSATSSSHAADGFSIRRAIADRILVLHGGKVTSGIELQGSSILQRVTIELPRSR